jgi:hypothetical protein
MLLAGTTRAGAFSAAVISALALSAGALAGCGNPVLDAKIEALGGEVDGIEAGPYHRPGQPCVLCHGPYEGASPEMSIGGTVFAAPSDKPIPVGEARVTLVDAAGETRTVKSNCIGNFYITTEQWVPLFPLTAVVECVYKGDTGSVRPAMNTRISRDGSCAGCHTGVPNQGSPGWVYCTTDAAKVALLPTPEPSCAGLRK